MNGRWGGVNGASVSERNLLLNEALWNSDLDYNATNAISCSLSKFNVIQQPSPNKSLNTKYIKR